MRSEDRGGVMVAVWVIRQMIVFCFLAFRGRVLDKLTWKVTGKVSTIAGLSP